MTDKPLTVSPAPIEVTLLGRTMALRQPTAAQIMLLHRAYRATKGNFDAFEAATDEAAKNDLASRGMMSAGGILDVVERLVAHPDDRAWLTEQLLEGRLDLPDLLKITQTIRAADESDESDEAPAAPVKKAARRAARKP